MAEFKIGRFRYLWRGTWETGTEYIRDDVVSYNGSSWVCVRQHTSGAFRTDQTYLANEGDTTPTPAWVKMTDGQAFRNQWTTSTAYSAGDIIIYGGNVWLCVADHLSSSTFETDNSNWTVYYFGVNFENTWQSSIRYGVGDTVRYGGIVYRCAQGHTSASTSNGLESDQSKWNVLFSGIEYKGAWTTATRYKLNDLVKFSGTIYRCQQGHTSAGDGSVDFNGTTKWAIEFPGFKFSGIWNDTTVYGIGDVVRGGGYLYYAKNSNRSSNPVNSIYQGGPDSDWEILSRSLNFRGDKINTQYKTGDVVRRGGNLWLALLDSTDDDSTLDYLDDSNWLILTESINWRGDWNLDQSYSVNDIVLFQGNTYTCTVDHESSEENFPGDNGSGFNFWSIYLEAGSDTGLKQIGDLLTYNLSRTSVGDGSTFGYTNVELGTEDQLLTINNDDTVIYKNYSYKNRVRYVSLDGVDDDFDENRGKDPFKPWRTVRYACEKLDDGFEGTTTIRVAPGLYDEVLPIIVPARTAIVGAELRTTRINAKPENVLLSQDSTYSIDALTRISQVLEQVITGQTLTPPKTSGNPLDPVIPIERVETIVSISGGGQEIVVTEEEVLGTVLGSDTVKDLIDDIIQYINFYVNSQGTSPVTAGTNTITTSQELLDTATILLANKHFLAEEAAAYIALTYPSYEFEPESCKRDIRRYIESWAYDLRYPGNYKSLLAARYYRNAVLGSEGEDMFYMRDATGLRNCTISGLAGALNPPNVFDLYRVPTGGSFVSLDPGWGPADNRTWITTRSPYIQGVTTFGTGCTGQKIDGALHNGGNKSIVSNDFTQVISDGIGAWVENNGRAELVSVFTYYCHVGYLAVDGGIIRGTNGNCSYGRFGAVADGVDLTEVPKTTTVNTRNQEAIVAQAFAGDFTDEIQILEWTNAGQEYTQASASFLGAGVSASVIFEDFRDDAVFEARRIDTSTNIVPNTGGGGYTVVGNNAQIGTDTTITIAANDPNSEADYLGMRLIITSGSGTGQYGYITAYDEVTKVVNISRESDNQPGWDHVIPGRPNQTLGVGSTYRIEPRVIFSEPEYNSLEIDTSITEIWSGIAYGETTETYTDLIGSLGTGDVEDQDGLVPVAARFTVVKSGRTYQATITTVGAGYAVNDVITISGDELGGSTPINDLRITVTEISNDSTNSIINFTYSGVGASGRFVAVSSASNTAMYSSDGENWTSTSMPSIGNWTCIASGDNKFVAIRNGSNLAASSLDGITWVSRTMPANRSWNGVAYGNNKFVAVAGNLNSGAYSTNGTTWTSMTMPTFGDSSINEWVDVTYGKGIFLVIANSNNVCATSNDGITWEGHIMDVINDSTQKDWVSVAYGNNRFVAITSTGEVGYSFDGTNWLPATMPTQDGSTAHNWTEIRYSQGVFFAVGNSGSRTVFGDVTTGPSTFSATSFDGIVWNSRELSGEEEWTSVAFGNPYIDLLDSSTGKNTPMWVAVANNTSNINKIRTGTRALGRVSVTAGVISEIKLWDTGSGYQNPPTVTLIDPNNTSDVAVDPRIADGVLTNPSWINRGLGYRTSTTRVTISGNGFADVIPEGKFVTISALENYPGPGAQIIFDGNETRYTIVTVESKTLEVGGLGYSARIRVSPELRNRDNLEHGTTATIREQYSQIRITGHDFLDIGTGNFEETNYPEIYNTGFFTGAPENEVVEEDGGRVFYTSTDQTGNFRTGELFSVEQSTGIVTISADFFDLGGLTELRLGGIRVGGTGVVIREFSTDPLFTEDSNNIVPTQRAIRAYLANRLSIGGSEIAVSSFIAGTILVGPDRFNNVAGQTIIIPRRADFDQELSNISGSILAQTMFYRSFGIDN
jgi:hypothetical protein